MKRLLSWLLALVMIISCLPLSAIPAFAVDVETGDGSYDWDLEFDEFTEKKLVDGDNAVELTEGDRDGESYIYTATSAGELNINVTALSAYEVVEFDENGEPVYGWSECPPMAIAMAFGRNYAILANGEAVGASGKIEVAEGEEVKIQVLSYVGAAAKMTVNLAVTEPVIPGTTPAAPLDIDWVLGEGAYTATVTIPANTTYYYNPFYAAIYDFSIVEGATYELAEGVLSITNDTDAEASYTLRAAIPAGQYDNPEVINGWTNFEITKEFVDTYYYIWVATQEDTVTLDVTDGYNLQVVQKYFDGTEDVQIDHNLVEMDEVTWEDVVKENLVIEVQEGDVLLITVASRGLEGTPASYTLTGDLKSAEVPVIPAEATLKIAGATLGLQDLIKMKITVNVTTSQKIVKTGGLFWTKEQYAEETDFTVNSKLAYNAVAEGTSATYSVYGEGVLAQNLDVQYYFIPYVETEYGYVYGSAIQPSPIKYCTSQLKTGSEELKSLIVDLLNYANAARNYFVIAQGMPVPETPINSILNDAQKVVGWSEDLRTSAPAYDTSNGGYTIKPSGVSVNLGEAISLQVKFTATDVAGGIYWDQKDFDAYSSNLSLDNKTADVTSITFPSGTVTQLNVGGLYAYNIFDFYYVRAYNAEGLMSRTVGASVAAYLTSTLKNAEKATDDANVALADLCKAMLVYGNNASTNSVIGRG